MTAALEQRGYLVSPLVYDELPTRRAKVHHKVRHELAERVGLSGTAAREQRISARVLSVLREVRPDVILVVKGDLLSDDVWQAFPGSGARTALWMYDELRRTRLTVERLRHVGPLASYSRLDTEALNAAGIDCVYVPGGFDSLHPVIPAPSTPEVSFIGARYPQRERLLTEVHSLGVPVRAYGRDWSHDWRDKARTWSRQRPDLPADRDIDRSRAYGVMAASTASLNVHGDQDGFTLRTFEAPGVGALPLEDRDEVSEFYDVGTETLTFAGAEEVLEHYLRAHTDLLWARRIREAGQRKTLEKHTLGHRMAELEKLWM
ncbi:glycosyltransferase [Ornithinimicrobium sp. Arc0846-15]|nr:glycosyltransferase [Ornithinimicrobium laminariae]